MPVQFYQALIGAKEQLTPKVYKARIDLVQPQTIQLLAGQFVNIAIPGTKVRRSYSVSSSPKITTWLETYVDISPGGPGSLYFSNAQPGDVCDFFGSFGAVCVY